MIQLGEYDPRLEGIWWVEEAGMSCNVYYLAEGRTRKPSSICQGAFL